MIITRTPFRVSFAGGGTDLPAFHRLEPGVVITTAIDKYMYMAVKDLFGKGYRVSYSRTELVETIERIEHPIVRECLRKVGIERGLEIVSMADLPARSGIGSSSAFTVGLLHALYAAERRVVSAERLAREACEIEIERLGEPIGKQDQYIAAYGGLQWIQFNPDGTVFVDPIVCGLETRREFAGRLLLFYTGITRDARDVLTRQSASTERKLPVLRELCRIAFQMREILTTGRELDSFGELLHQAWETKKNLEESISNARIDEYYERARKAGAIGGKLLGAGTGGFLLFYCPPERQDGLRAALADLTPVPFHLDPQGSKIVHVGSDL